jgi:hypothetical protein
MTLYTSKEMIFSPDDLPAPWRRAESVICDKYDPEEDHGSYYDAREADGTPVEIKSCVAIRPDGTPGRFEVWESQIDELLVEGKVGLLVYDPDLFHNIVATRLAPIIAILGSGTTVRWQHPTMGCQPRKRIPWPELVSLDETSFTIRRACAEFYDEEEVEATILPSDNSSEDESGEPGASEIRD